LLWRHRQPSADCSTVPDGGVVVGGPAYIWQLNNNTFSGNGYGCNAFTNGTTSTGTYNPCGQTESWYEDDSNDTSATDELLYSIVVTQGSAIIADSGEVDFGPNPTVVSLRQRMSSFPATRTSATLRERLLARTTATAAPTLTTHWRPEQTREQST